MRKANYRKKNTGKKHNKDLHHPCYKLNDIENKLGGK
jgi:hypothetical protein